jgi:predicted AAA+ superfamily ATPase
VAEYGKCIEDIMENSMIERAIFGKINEFLFQNRIILIFGTRRVGKTTLLRQIIAEYEFWGKKCIYLNGDLLSAKQALETT